MNRYVTTITVNQWRIKENAEQGLDQPTICVNTYEYCAHKSKACGVGTEVEWGPRVGETCHFHDLDILVPSRVVYDPSNKTPCGASCWMQVEGTL